MLGCGLLNYRTSPHCNGVRSNPSAFFFSFVLMVLGLERHTGIFQAFFFFVLFCCILGFSKRGTWWRGDAGIRNACAAIEWYTETVRRLQSDRRVHGLGHGDWDWGVFEAFMRSRRARNLIIIISSASHLWRSVPHIHLGLHHFPTSPLYFYSRTDRGELHGAG